MRIDIRGDKVKVTDAIKKQITEKLGKLDQYFENPEELKAYVVIRVKNKEQTIEVTIPTPKFTLRSETSEEDLYAAIDLTIDKLERQIRKNKTRMSKKVIKDKIPGFMTDFKVEKKEDDKSKIVKLKSVELKPMSEEEAILQMNLIDHTFFIFRNSKTGDIEVIYKREDGNYGLIKEK